MNWKTCPLHAVISGYEFNKFASTNDDNDLFGSHTKTHMYEKNFIHAHMKGFPLNKLCK